MDNSELRKSLEKQVLENTKNFGIFTKIDYSKGCARYNKDTCDCDLAANQCKHRDYKEYELEQKLSACEIVLEDTQREIRLWKSVEFERPEIGVIVCIMLKGSDYCHVGFRANGGWYLFALNSKSWIPNDAKSGVKITHWQELPKILGTDAKALVAR